MYLVSDAECAASAPEQDWWNAPRKCLVPVLEELLEDDGLLPLWQNLHLQQRAHERSLLVEYIKTQWR